MHLIRLFAVCLEHFIAFTPREINISTPSVLLFYVVAFSETITLLRYFLFTNEYLLIIVITKLHKDKFIEKHNENKRAANCRSSDSVWTMSKMMSFCCVRFRMMANWRLNLKSNAFVGFVKLSQSYQIAYIWKRNIEWRKNPLIWK